MTTKTVTLHPSGLNYVIMSSYSYITDSANPITNAIGKGTDSETYAQWGITTIANGYSRIVYTFDFSSIPDNATITQINCSAKVSIGNITSQFISSRKLYLRYVMDGAWYMIGNVDIPNSPTIVNPTSAVIQREYLDTYVVDFMTQRGKKTQSVYQRCYGIDLTITYTVPEEVITDKLYVKESGAWKAITDVYKKVSGTWIKQDDVTTVFSEFTKLVKKTIEKTNLFDRTGYGYEPGGLLNAQGSFSGWGPGCVSNYIAVDSASTYSVSNAATSWQKVFYYDESYTFISYNASLSYEEPLFRIGPETNYIIPSQAKYVRVNALIATDLIFEKIT